MEPNQLKTNWLPALELISFLERGDLIEICRQSYTHWVIYIGIFEDINCVAHISTDKHGNKNIKEIGAKLLRSAALVRSDSLLLVAGTDLCRVNNSLDAQRRPFPPTIIVERALTKELVVTMLCITTVNTLLNGADIHFEKSLLGQAGVFGLASFIATTSLPYSLAGTAATYTILKISQAMKRNYVMRNVI